MDPNLQLLNKNEEKTLEKLKEKYGFQEEKQQNAGPQQAPEGFVVIDHAQVHQNLDDQIEDILQMDNQQAEILDGKQLTVPSEQELYGEYNKEGFQEKKLHKSRESKIKNKKSRLYRKNLNASKMASFEKKDYEQRDLRAKLRRGMNLKQRMHLSINIIYT